MLWLGAVKHSCGWTLGKEEWFHAMPFTESFGLCFQYLIPKVAPTLERFKDLLGEWVDQLKIGKYKGKDPMPLCLAIKKLMDSED